MGDLDPHLIHDPWAILRSQSKWHDDRFSRFRSGDRSVSMYGTLLWAPLSPRIAPSYGGELNPI